MKKYGKLTVSITLGLALATVGMADSYAAPVIEGANVTATDEVAVAIGSDIKIEGTEAIGIGSCIKANGMNEIAIGFGRESIGDSVTGIGNFSEAYGMSVVGVGNYQILGNPEDGYEGMVGIGDYLAVYSSYGTAVGFCAESRGEGAVAIGSDTQAVSAYSVALGAKSIAGGCSSGIVCYDRRYDVRFCRCRSICRSKCW